MRSEHYYLTTPIYYVNDVPHLGHAYTTIAADALARWHRMFGTNTRFLTGTDEHGLKIEKAATERGITPQELADSVVIRFEELWQKLDISHDDFIRTTQDRHKLFVQDLWRRLHANGDIYLGSYEGWYCVADEAFYTEKEIVNGLSPTGRPVELVREPSWFFRLSRFQEPLLKWYKDNPDCIRPKERYNEIVSFVEGGLNDLSVSRANLNWGIDAPETEGHTVYVWLDALTNYMSALGPLDEPLSQKFWPADLHLIGKDILRFHAVFWPAFLLSAELSLPRQVFAHGWWTVEGEKMSKTTRNVVDPNRLIEEYGSDAVRYFVLREVPFGSDGDFSHRAMIDRVNADLANDIGNLMNRVSGMTMRYFDNCVPAGNVDSEIATDWEATVAEADELMQNCQFNRALERIWAFLGQMNVYIDHKAPWKLAKDPNAADELAAILRTCLEACAALGSIVMPIMPDTSVKIAAWLGTEKVEPASFSRLKDGTRLGPLLPLFPRIEEDTKTERLAAIAREIEGDAVEETAFTPDPLQDETSIDDFFSTDLRVGLITTAEDLPKSKKLLKLQVDVGEAAPRQILAGIKLHFSPEDLVGRKVVVVANLKPAKLMGLESQGMVLAASDVSGLTLVDPGDRSPGARVK